MSSSDYMDGGAFQQLLIGETVRMIRRLGLDVGIAFALGMKKAEQLTLDQRSVMAGARVGNLTRLMLRMKLPMSRVWKSALSLLGRIFQSAASGFSWQLMGGRRRYTLRHRVQQDMDRALDVILKDIRKEAQLVILPALQEMLREANVVSSSLIEETQLISARVDRMEKQASEIARRIAINVGSDEVMLRTQVGYLLCGAYDHALIACLLESGELELGTRLLIEKFLKPGDVFVDVGANVGMHTLAAGRAMRRQGKIVAFEPFEHTKRMLEKTIWVNGLSDIAEVHQFAVSNICGSRQLYIGPVSGHHSLFELDSSPGNIRGSVEVDLVRLDDILSRGEQIDLIKIDVEGAELEVVEGGKALLDANPNVALIVEFGPSHLRRAGLSADDWFAVFESMGFDYRLINAETGLLEQRSRSELERVETANLFYARGGSTAWKRLP